MQYIASRSSQSLMRVIFELERHTTPSRFPLGKCIVKEPVPDRDQETWQTAESVTENTEGRTLCLDNRHELTGIQKNQTCWNFAKEYIDSHISERRHSDPEPLLAQDHPKRNEMRECAYPGLKTWIATEGALLLQTLRVYIYIWNAQNAVPRIYL